MDSVSDFSSYGHPLTRWFGFSSFVTLESDGPDSADVEEAVFLLSTLTIAADNAHVATPLFASFGRGRPRDYLGYMVVAGDEAVVARFCCRAARPPGSPFTTTSLVEDFYRRMGAAGEGSPAVAMSIHCTWRTLVNAHAGWQQPVALAPGARHRECQWGPETDPVAMLELATTCQVMLEHGVSSLSQHAQLNRYGVLAPELCSHWSLLALLDDAQPGESGAGARAARKGRAPLAASFGALLDAMSEADGFATIKQAAEYRPMLETLTRSLLEPVGSLVPTPDELAQMVTELFDRDHPASHFVAQTTSSAGAAVLPNVKSAPPLTLLASLCMYMLNVEGLAAVAVVYLEFVRELRWHWDHFELLPRMPFDAPGHAYSSLYQQLQMLNWCIARRVEHNERAKGEGGDSHKAALGGWSDVEFDSVDDDDVDNDNDDDDKGDGGDDGAQHREKRNPAVRNDSAPAVAPALSSPPPQVREGVKEETQLRLLATGAPLCVPVTQDTQTFMTEDMMLEQQQLLLSLGSDKTGSEMRAQMQAQSLLSDMEAFRAANPGCVLQDFVRWHSDKDWVVTPVGDKDADSSPGEQSDGSWIYADAQTDRLVRGRMSARMAESGNLWHTTWADARVMPVARQKPLVDHVREGERVLHRLESIEPQTLLRQCALVALSAMHHMFAVLPAARVPVVSQQLSSLGAAMIDVGGPGVTLESLASFGPEDLQPCLAALERVERVSSSAASLLAKLNNNTDLVHELLSGSRALVEAEAQRHVVRRLFTDKDVLPAPHGREFLLRSLRGPASTLPNRMYVMINSSDEAVRVCTALTESDAL